MELIDGGLFVDDRGQVSFVNGFDFLGVKRFYLVENHEKGFIRAWHGHKIESKYVFVTKGTVLMGVVDLETEVPETFILSANKPQVLYIPAGHANGFKTLTDDAQIMFFSTTTLEESHGDDYRYDYKKWDIWEIERR